MSFPLITSKHIVHGGLWDKLELRWRDMKWQWNEGFRNTTNVGSSGNCAEQEKNISSTATETENSEPGESAGDYFSLIPCCNGCKWCNTSSWIEKAYAAVFSHQSEWWYLESLISSEVVHGVKCLRHTHTYTHTSPNLALPRRLGHEEWWGQGVAPPMSN